MGTALTQEQFAELRGRAGTAAGRAGARRRPRGPRRDAARGARGGGEGDVELMVVEMPEGRIRPISWGAAGGGVHGAARTCDLGDPSFRFVGYLPMQTSTRRRQGSRTREARGFDRRHRPNAPQRGTRWCARSRTRSTCRSTTWCASSARGAAARQADRAGRARRRRSRRHSTPSRGRERSFLAVRRARSGLRHRYLARLTDEHLERLRHARGARLAEGTSTTRSRASRGRPRAGRARHRRGHGGRGARRTDAVLRMSFLQLELRRIERELRRAGREATFAPERARGGRAGVRGEIDAK